MAAELAQLVQRAAREDTSLEMPSILWLEHLNLVCGRREATEAFYLHALGCTLDTNRRDANLGQQQFHLNAPQSDEAALVLSGTIGLCVPGLAALKRRLEYAANAMVGGGGAAAQEMTEALQDTQFAWEDCGEHVRVTGPWGNVFLIWDSEAMMEDVNHFVAPPRMVSMNEV